MIAARLVNRIDDEHRAIAMAALEMAAFGNGCVGKHALTGPAGHGLFNDRANK